MRDKIRRIVGTPDQSFTLTGSNTVRSVKDAHRHGCEEPRCALLGLAVDDVVEGRGERTVRALYLEVPRELGQRFRTCRNLP